MATPRVFVNASYRMDPEVAQMVEAHAEREGISRNEAVQDLIRAGYSAKHEEGSQMLNWREAKHHETDDQVPSEQTQVAEHGGYTYTVAYYPVSPGHGVSADGWVWFVAGPDGYEDHGQVASEAEAKAACEYHASKM